MPVRHQEGPSAEKLFPPLARPVFGSTGRLPRVLTRSPGFQPRACAMVVAGSGRMRRVTVGEYRREAIM